MKRTLAILLALLLGLSLLAGCGKEKPEDPDNPGNADNPNVPAQGEPYQFEYYSFMLTDGWYFYDKSASVELRNDGIEGASMKLYIYSGTAEEKMENNLAYNEGVIQEENVTLGDIEYIVGTVESVNRIYLDSVETFTMVDEKWNSEKQYGVDVLLTKATIEQAAPVLETIEVNDKILEIKHEFPETQEVDSERFSYTASGGWYLYNQFDRPYLGSTKGELKKDASGVSPYMWVSYALGSIESTVERNVTTMKVSPEGETIDVNGVAWLVLSNEDGKTLILLSTGGPALDMEQKAGALSVRLSNSSVEEAMPILETLKLK